MAARRRTTTQAWIEPLSYDPEAVSALTVARARLPAARGLVALRRLLVFELFGVLPASAEVARLLHRSTQFYNPHKERCTVRARPADPAPVDPAERVVLVLEKDGARRPAAERWWRHETGAAIEVSSGVAWALRFEPGVDAEAFAEDLARVRDRRHGLLCNPLAQEARIAAGKIPLPWLAAPSRGAGTGGRT